MSTLVCRLAGPLQSWGEHARFTHRGTLPYPTYAGLLGLCRAALGHTRDGNNARTGQPADHRWLYEFGMAVRIDQPGRTVGDYHTVNPPPANRYHWLAAEDRRRLATVAMGNGRPWVIQGAQPTLQTWRSYLTDAVFTWLVDGPDTDIDRLTEALLTPYWQLSLGRKACLPDQPLVLGTTPLPVTLAAAEVPATGVDGRRTLHLLTTPTDAQPATRTVTHADAPLGPHSQHGYTYLTRTITHVHPPAAGRDKLLNWAKEHLT